MSAYDDNLKDNLLDEIKDFLKERPVSELLAVVAYAVEIKEQGYLD